MKKWFATLMDDLKFLGSECKKEFTDLEITPASQVRDNPSRPKTAYVPYSAKNPTTNLKFYRH